jgi:hypothetical protein
MSDQFKRRFEKNEYFYKDIARVLGGRREYENKKIDECKKCNPHKGKLNQECIKCITEYKMSLVNMYYNNDIENENKLRYVKYDYTYLLRLAINKLNTNVISDIITTNKYILRQIFDDEYQSTPLLYLLRTHKLDNDDTKKLFKLFLENSDIDYQDSTGSTALIIIEKLSEPSIPIKSYYLHEILKKRANVNLRNSAKKTALNIDENMTLYKNIIGINEEKVDNIYIDYDVTDINDDTLLMTCIKNINDNKYVHYIKRMINYIVDNKQTNVFKHKNNDNKDALDIYFDKKELSIDPEIVIDITKYYNKRNIFKHPKIQALDPSVIETLLTNNVLYDDNDVPFMYMINNNEHKNIKTIADKFVSEYKRFKQMAIQYMIRSLNVNMLNKLLKIDEKLITKLDRNGNSPLNALVQFVYPINFIVADEKKVFKYVY